MEAAAAGSKQQPPSESDPRARVAKERAQGEADREMVEHAALGAELDENEERQALDWLLGAPTPVVHDVPVQYETPSGLTRLVFVLKQIDSRKIDEIEQRHIAQAATRRVDQLGADIEIVTEATLHLRDQSGRTVDLNSDEFKTVMRRTARGNDSFKHASPSEALEERFRKQLGLISGVAAEVRRMAGFEPSRVGEGQRRLVDASLG